MNALKLVTSTSSILHILELINWAFEDVGKRRVSKLRVYHSPWCIIATCGAV